MKDGDRTYLLHIQDFISQILIYTKGGKDDFLGSRLVQDAVVRNIEIIGEAVKNLSSEAKAAHPEIPWREIARMRDKLIHHYFGIQLKLVWEAVEKDIPALNVAVVAMLQELDKNPPPSPP